MKYKIGNRVKIRDDLVEDEKYGGVYFIPDMLHCRGKLATIKECTNYGCYHIDIDKNDWNWTDEMFENEINELDHFQEQLDESFAELLRKYQELQKELNVLKKKYNENDV